MPGNAAYVAAKHGVIGLTRAAALELAGTGVRVNAVCPTFTDTAMVRGAIDAGMLDEAAVNGFQPVGRMGTPEEVADAVVWLCSAKAQFVTGHALPVDGGVMAGRMLG